MFPVTGCLLLVSDIMIVWSHQSQIKHLERTLENKNGIFFRSVLLLFQKMFRQLGTNHPVYWIVVLRNKCVQMLLNETLVDVVFRWS